MASRLKVLAYPEEAAANPLAKALNMRSMADMKTFTSVIAIALPALILGLLIAYLVGLRVFVIQPIGALPNGAVAVVHGLPDLRPIDSPDAICQRNQGYVNLICRGATGARVARDSTILLRLPYAGWVYALSGAPDVR